MKRMDNSSEVYVQRIKTYYSCDFCNGHCRDYSSVLHSREEPKISRQVGTREKKSWAARRDLKARFTIQNWSSFDDIIEVSKSGFMEGSTLSFLVRPIESTAIWYVSSSLTCVVSFHGRSSRKGTTYDSYCIPCFIAVSINPSTTSDLL